MTLAQYLIDVTPFKSKHQMSKICKTSSFIPYSFLVPLLVPLGPLILVLLGPLILVPLGTLILVPLLVLLETLILVLLGPFCT